MSRFSTRLQGALLAMFLSLVPASLAYAQASAPVPGGPPQSAAPVPGQPYSASPLPTTSSTPGRAPVPGAPPPSAPSQYQQLPLSVNDAQTRLDELKSLLPDARVQDIQEPIYHLCEWLADMAEGHNRLAVSFAKHDSTRREADTERRSAYKFSQLKHQAQLLKADLLIKQQRYPEALVPLVEIVSAEPRTATGQAAYKRLREIGFAEEPEAKAEAKLEPVQEVQPTSAVQPASPNASPVVTVAKPEPSRAPVAAPQRAVRQVSPQQAGGHSPTLWITGSPTGGAR